MRINSTVKSETIIENGKTKFHRKVEEIKVPYEPDYVKLYLKDIGRLMELPKGQLNFLYILFSKMEKDTLLIEISTGGKKVIAEELKTTTKVIDNNLSFLTKKNIIERRGVGLFRGNPNLFGKGKWSNIYEIRLEVKYNKNGKMIKAEFKEEKKE